MSDSAQQTLSEMPASTKVFTVLSAATEGCAARIGRLALPGRKAMDTPNYTAISSRGAVPHLTPDTMERHTRASAAYVALEDFIEKKNPPIYKTPDSAKRRLHSFTALPSDLLTILAARRCPAVVTPAGNTSKILSIFTSTGFDKISVPQYADAIRSLQPDIAIAMADLLHTSQTPPSKKLIRMTERTEEWGEVLMENLQAKPMAAGKESFLFAPVLAVEHPYQWSYLKSLSTDSIDAISGLAIYGLNMVPELTNYPALTPLPKLSMDVPATPQEVLKQVSLGIDICLLPFINVVSDAGVAMTFTFPPTAAASPQPLGTNIWSPEHVVDMGPLSEHCTCYACTKHHRSYMHHLLNAKEMLGWNLLQVHNHAVVDAFFKGIRDTLAQSPAAFEEAKEKFLATYEESFPEGTGERPRARGYHFKSEGGDEKINKTTWRELQDTSEPKGGEAIAGTA